MTNKAPELADLEAFAARILDAWQRTDQDREEDGRPTLSGADLVQEVGDALEAFGISDPYGTPGLRPLYWGPQQHRQAEELHEPCPPCCATCGGAS